MSCRYSTRPKESCWDLAQNRDQKPLTYVDTLKNLTALTDDTLTDDEWFDALRAIIRPARDAIHAELDRLLPPAEIERRLAAVKAAVAEQARQDSNLRRQA